MLASSLLSPRLIKLDLQVAELHALRGMQQTLLGAEDLALILELWPRGLRACGSDPRELVTMLEASGFRGGRSTAVDGRRKGAQPKSS